MTNLKLKHKIDCLPQNAKILDAGGWFKPFPSATHVVDLMPWESRGAKLQLETLPNERFTKETWYQTDFLKPDFKLPFDDKYFDFSICSHTLEDLIEPLGLIRELMRVSQAGYIEVPSRFYEQTIGIKDRSSSVIGHSHHQWIIDKEENTLVFCKKQDSLIGDSYAIPLELYEKNAKDNSDVAITYLFWVNQFEVNFEFGSVAINKAREFRQSLPTSWQGVIHDKVLRAGRRTRNFILKQNKISTDKWWKEIVELSQPYSLINLS